MDLLRKMKASVIIPAYNAEKTIRECLKSVFAQNLGQSFEVIVVDDGSTDSTKAIVKEFIRENKNKKKGIEFKKKLKKNKRIELIELPHFGPARARNAGAQKASGEIVVFTDADCTFSENWLKEMLGHFSDANVAGVQGAYKSKQKNLIARFTQLEIEDRYNRMKRFETIDFIGSYSAAYRRELFLQENGFDTSFPIASGEDPELSYRIAGKGHKLVFNPNAILFHRHAESFFAYLKKKFWHAYWRTSLYKKHSQKIARDSYTPQSLKLQLVCVLLFFFTAIFGLIFNLKILLFVGLLFFVLLILLILPLTIFMLRKDFTVGVVSLPLLVARDIAMVKGLVSGMLFRK